VSRVPGRIASSEVEIAYHDFRRRFVPGLTILAAAFLAVLPFVTVSPILPDFGLLAFLAWRLLRPEVWTPWLPLPLGLAADLIAGHPLGQSMLLWTAIGLACEVVDTRLGFRDYVMDWGLAAGAIIFQTVGAWYIGLLMGSDVRFTIMIPQLLLTILAYPLASRIVIALDRWRLAR
jgi:rod shape-determining protein MreD